MPNTLAILMLLIWPVVTAVMYLQMPVQRALVWSVFSAYMVLPAAMEIDLPLIPGLSKYMIPAYFGYLMASITQGRLISLIPRSRMAQLFLAMVVFGTLGTVATNGDPLLVSHDTIISGLRSYDGLSMMMYNLNWLLVWALAREFLNDREGLLLFGRALVISFLIYSVPMLYEARMSPQLHIMIYGFFQHDFNQMMRQGGFRPIVFLEHGLWVAILTGMATMTALVLGRDAAPGQRQGWYRAAAYLTVLLVLCKSMAALIYTVMLLPIILWGRGLLMLRVALVLCIIIMTFPILRGAGVIPTTELVDWVLNYSVDRSQSLGFRFDNEDMLLERASERPVFGWGSWGRNSIFDPITGEDLSVTDGMWIILIGTGGYVGFIGFFGLLTAPVFLMGRACRRAGREVSTLAGGMALVLAVNLVDLLPNATISPLTWVLAGGMLGFLERIGESSATRPVQPVTSGGLRTNGFAGLIGSTAAAGPRSLL